MGLNFAYKNVFVKYQNQLNQTIRVYYQIGFVIDQIFEFIALLFSSYLRIKFLISFLISGIRFDKFQTQSWYFCFEGFFDILRRLVTNLRFRGHTELFIFLEPRRNVKDTFIPPKSWKIFIFSMILRFKYVNLLWIFFFSRSDMLRCQFCFAWNCQNWLILCCRRCERRINEDLRRLWSIFKSW